MLYQLEADNEMGIQWASPVSVCHFCQLDYLKENANKSYDENNPVVARKALQGKLSGQRIWNLGKICCCAAHVKKALELMLPAETKAEEAKEKQDA